MAKTGLKLTELDDGLLARLAGEGNQGAFLVLYDRYKSRMHVYVSKYLSQREEAEDVVMESFQKAFSQITSYSDTYRFSTWLYTIARNTAFDHLEKKGRKMGGVRLDSLDDEAEMRDVASPTGNPETEVIHFQEYDKIVDVMASLSDTYREAARMVLLENYGYQEAADALGLPLNTVKTRVKRAREKMMTMIERMDSNG